VEHAPHPAGTARPLPDWRARAFIARKGSSGQAEPERFEEVALRLTTAWFFPHLAQVALIWHGETAIAEDDAATSRT
jgi:hypothetical protein